MFSRIQSHHCRKPAPNVIQKKIKHSILIIAGTERKWEIQSCSTVCMTYMWAGFYYIRDFRRRGGRSINEFWVCYQRKAILLGHGFAVLFEKEGHGLRERLASFCSSTVLMLSCHRVWVVLHVQQQLPCTEAAKWPEAPTYAVTSWNLRMEKEKTVHVKVQWGCVLRPSRWEVPW